MIGQKNFSDFNAKILLMDAIASQQTRTNYFLHRMKALNLQFDLIILSLSKV